MMHPLDVQALCEQSGPDDVLANLSIDLIPFMESGDISDTGVIGTVVIETFDPLLNEVAKFFNISFDEIVGRFMGHADFTWDCYMAMKLKKQNRLH